MPLFLDSIKRIHSGLVNRFQSHNSQKSSLTPPTPQDKSVDSERFSDNVDVGCIPKQTTDQCLNSNESKIDPNHTKSLNETTHLHPIRQVINLGHIPKTVDFDPGPLPINIYDQGIIKNVM